MNFSKELKNLFVGFVMGLSDVDKKMIFGNENSAETQINAVQKSVDQGGDFLSAIKSGQLTEQQLKWFYNHLDKMDEFHKNGGAMAHIPGMLSEQHNKKQDSSEPGFEQQISFTNKLITNTTGSDPIPTLTILRNSSQRTRHKIEDYCNTILIKGNNSGTLIAEFYCTNYKLKAQSENDLKENLFKELSGSILSEFTNFEAFNAVRSTATRNGIDHAYKINKFKNILALDKGFVVKFYVEEL